MPRLMLLFRSISVCIEQFHNEREFSNIIKKTKEARASVKFGRIVTDSQIHDS